MVSTHNKEGGKNKVRVERGKGGKRKKRKRREGRGEGSWAELLWGPLLTFITHNEDG